MVLFLRWGLPVRAWRAQLTPYSARSVRRESGMEECGNTSGIQVLDEPWERSVVDHSTE